MCRNIKKASARALALLLAAAMLTALPVGASAASYSDVSQSDWFYSYVTDLSEAGVVNGYPDGSFGPGDKTTLGAALKLIMLAAGLGEQQPTGSHWASGYLKKAEAMGLLDSADSKALDGAVTRLTVARAAARAMSIARSMQSTPFTDVDDGSVTALYNAGVVTGSRDSSGALVFKPADSITRAEISAIVWRIRYTDVHAGHIDAGSYYVEKLEGVAVNPYDRTAFSTQNGYMTYSAAKTVRGIDVSEFQGDIDWAQVAAAGIEYAFIRVGYRGYGSTGSLNMDSNFYSNYEGARAAGIKVGAYFFSQAISEREAVEEAEYLLKALDGRTLDYPVLFDWEPITYDTARTDDIAAETLCAAANAFCAKMERAGLKPLIYSNCYTAYTKYDLRNIKYDICLSEFDPQPDYYYSFTMWQYSDKGSVPGIKGNVDLSISFVDYGG